MKAGCWIDFMIFSGSERFQGCWRNQRDGLVSPRKICNKTYFFISFSRVKRSNVSKFEQEQNADFRFHVFCRQVGYPSCTSPHRVCAHGHTARTNVHTLTHSPARLPSLGYLLWSLCHGSEAPVLRQRRRNRFPTHWILTHQKSLGYPLCYKAF